MIVETMNEVVTNLTGRIGEVIETIAAVSQTVVQETSQAGFVYTMIGLGTMGFCAICIVATCLVLTLPKSKEVRDICSTFLILGAALSFVTGLWVTLHNLGCWIAPTREVILEIVGNI